MTNETLVALVGFPNIGKTTLFNTLTGKNHKIVNYPGSTVDFGVGSVQKEDTQWTFIDTPGIVSVDAISSDELVTIDALTKTNKLLNTAKTKPDLVIYFITSSQFERHLSLLKQLEGYKIPVMVLLREENGAPAIEIDTLGALIHAPIYSFEEKKFDSTHIYEMMKKALNTPITYDQKDCFDPYKWAQKISEATITQTSTSSDFDFDTILLHPITGMAIFSTIMGAFFWTIFVLAAPFIDGIAALFDQAAIMVQTHVSTPVLADALANGLITGAGSVFVFVPQIFILFFGIGLMESSGYLSRGATILDRPLSFIGLNGRSFVPLLSGCACAIPAMMATRSIPGKKARFLTMFIIPLMTCSAKLPVFGLLLTLLFIDSPSHAAIGLTAIYFGSFALASIIAAIAGRLIRLESNQDTFHIDLPRWKMPNLTQTFMNAFEQSITFLKGAGPIILGLSLFMWGITTYPSPDHSIAQSIGTFLNPLWAPLGFDWRVGIPILLSFSAREVFVSGLMVTFAITSESTADLTHSLIHATLPNGLPLFTTGSTIGLVLFFMVSMQCISTLAIAKKESKSWTFPLLITVFYICLAYVLAFLSNLVF